MQRGFVHAVAWSLATGAAVTLSWWGVHTVMAGTAYDPPQALPIPTDLPAQHSTAQGAKPQASSTRRPDDKKSKSGAPEQPESPAGTGHGTPVDKNTPSPSRTPDSSGKPSGSGSLSPSSPPAAADSQVKSYNTDGGRVTFDLGKTSATLVSATPATGWSMQVWKDPTWIRVEFTAGAASVSVFCTWHDHEPTVEIVKS